MRWQLAELAVRQPHRAGASRRAHHRGPHHHYGRYRRVCEAPCPPHEPRSDRYAPIGPATGRAADHLCVRRSQTAGVAAVRDPGRRGWWGDLLCPERLERVAVARRDRAAPAGQPREPVAHAAVDAHRPGRGRGPPPPGSAGAVGEADRPERQRRVACGRGGRRGGCEPPRGRRERQSRPSARRVPPGRELHRRVSALVLEQSRDGRPARQGVHRRPAGSRASLPRQSTSQALAPPAGARTQTCGR